MLLYITNEFFTNCNNYRSTGSRKEDREPLLSLMLAQRNMLRKTVMKSNCLDNSYILYALANHFSNWEELAGDGLAAVANE